MSTNVIPFPTANLTATEARALRAAEREAAMLRHPAGKRPTPPHTVAVTLAQRVAKRNARRRLMFAVRWALATTATGAVAYSGLSLAGLL